MQLSNFSHRRLISAAALACAAALIPAAALAATTSPEAPAEAGHPAAVPAGFRPTSASFYSPAAGVVVGGVGCQLAKPCKARLVATTDSGAHWSSVKAPSVAVTVVMFASARDGWLYGQTGRFGERVGGLWATHDRGAHWRKLSVAGGVIDSMAASAGTVYAVVSHGNNGPRELYASPAGRNAWARVRHFSVSADTGSALAVSGRSAWFGGGTSLWATADGVHWHRYPLRCPAGYSGNTGGLAGIAAASPSRLWLVCVTSPGAGNQGKDLLRSVNGGKTTHLVETIPVGGEVAGFAAPPGRPEVITLATQVSLGRSANGGKTWTQDFSVPGGTSWSPLTYISRNMGWVVCIQLGQLLRTTDAGATWHQVSTRPRPAHPVTAYVADGRSGTVTPINTATNKAGKAIKIPGPGEIAITPNGKTAYVLSASNTVTPIRTTTNTALKAIKVGSGPDAIAITPNGTTAYVADGGSNTVTPISTATNKPGKAIKVGSGPAVSAIKPDGKTAYVANADSNTVTPISIATGTPGKAIKVGSAPTFIAITPNGTTAYVVNTGYRPGRGTVTPINTVTNTPGKAIKIRGNGSIAITPNGKTAYVCTGIPGARRGTVTPINTATNTAGKAIKIAGGGCFAIAITPRGKTAYVTNGVRAVIPIDTATGTALKAIKVGSDPQAIAITPNGKTAYIANEGGAFTPGDTVTAIRTATNTVLKTIKVGSFPGAIAITP